MWAVLHLVVAALGCACCGDATVEQHGVSFEPVMQGTNQLWLAELERGDRRVKVAFTHLPDETSSVTVKPETLAWLAKPDVQASQVYISTEPDAAHYTLAAAGQVGRVIEDLGLFDGASVKLAFRRENDRPERLPLVGCSQAVDGTVVIVVQQGLRDELKLQGACLRATYQLPQRSLLVAERLSYALAGVL